MSHVDLHAHSNVPDGALSPEQVVRLTHETRLSVIAPTDHDITAGVTGAVETGAELGLEVVPGIEVSSSFRDHRIHILGLFVDTDPPSFQATLKEFHHYRDQHNQEMLGRFDAHGIHLIAGDLCAGNPDTVTARAYVVKALLAKGLGPDLGRIFKRYLQYGSTRCPPKELLPPEAITEALLNSHAFAALVHPFQYKLGDKATEELITYLADLGMKGLEVYHSSHSRLEGTKLQEMATCRHLSSIDGSDFRDSNRPDISIGTGRGDLWIPSLLLDTIKDTL